jgi:hypothetical protein
VLESLVSGVTLVTGMTSLGAEEVEVDGATSLTVDWLSVLSLGAETSGSDWVTVCSVNSLDLKIQFNLKLQLFGFSSREYLV